MHETPDQQGPRRCFRRRRDVLVPPARPGDRDRDRRAHGRVGGQPLAVIETTEIDLEVTRLAAELRAATADADALRAGAPRDVRRAMRAQVRATRRRLEVARRRYAKLVRLVRVGAAPGDEVDEGRAAVAQVEEELGQVMVRYHESRRGRPEAVAAAVARVESAQASLERGRRERERYSLRAPMTGEILA